MNPALIAAVIRGARAYSMVSAGRRAFGGRRDRGQPTEASQMRESQQRFLDRLNRGDVISDEELASAPAGHVPEELSERRWKARFSRVAGSAGGAAGGGGGGAGGAAAGGGYVPPRPPGGGASGGPADETGPGLSDFVRTLAKAAATVTGFVKGLELFNRGVIAIHQSLSQFDGRLAQAYASLEVADIRRGQERSQRMGGSLSALIAAQNELRDTTYGIGTEVQGLISDLAGTVTRGVNAINKSTSIGETTVTLLQGIRSHFDNEATAVDLPPWSNFFNDVSSGTFEGKVQQFPVNAGGPGATRRSARASALQGRPGP